MEYINTFLYYADKVIDPTVSYFVLLSLLLIALIAIRGLFKFLTKYTAEKRRRERVVKMAVDAMNAQKRPIEDPWMNAHDGADDMDRFEKTVRMKARGTEVQR